MIQDPQDVQASESGFSRRLAPRTAILDMFTRKHRREGQVTGAIFFLVVVRFTPPAIAPKRAYVP